jgi:hypothetical protein
MAKDSKSKDVEDDEEKSSSGSSNMIVYGLIGFLFILVIIAMILAGLGLSNVPETWSWSGNIPVISATVPDVPNTPTDDQKAPKATFSNDDVSKTYNILSVHKPFTCTDASVVITPSIDISGFKGSNANKVLRVLNNGLVYTPTGGTATYVPLTVTGFVQPTNSDIATITLRNGEYAEFLQQTNTNPTFMGISYNAPVSTSVTTTISGTTGTGTGTGTLSQKGQ